MGTETMTTPEILSRDLCGARSRYLLVQFRRRFGTIEWHVTDAETPDAVTGLPSIIRQAATAEAAMAGLDGEDEDLATLCDQEAAGSRCPRCAGETDTDRCDACESAAHGLHAQRDRASDETAPRRTRGRNETTIMTQTTTPHPLRVAVLDSTLRVAVARAAVEAAERLDLPTEPCDAALRAAEDALDAATRDLVGSDCPREWALCEAGYTYDTETHPTVEAALASARDGVDAGNYPTDDDDDTRRTLRITIRVTCDETGESEAETVTCEPEAPECDAAAHDWRAPHSVVGGLRETPGVVGHGGGIIATTVCAWCGWYRRYDSSAQDLETGEHGHEETEYREPDDESRAWVRRLAAARERSA